jgi:hypothetical protein
MSFVDGAGPTSTAPQLASQQRAHLSPHSGDSEPISKADVIAWTQRGMGDEQIIDLIERTAATFDLTAADVNELRDRGVRPAVIHAMRRAGP